MLMPQVIFLKGIAFVDVLIYTFNVLQQPIITTENSVQFPKDIDPFTNFSVRITSYTYWGTSPPTSVQIHSPPSTPSAPMNLRTFIEYEDQFLTNGNLVSLIVRWDVPEHPNGIIQGYDIRCWYNDNETEIEICDGITTEAHQTEYKLIHTDKLKNYYFQVIFWIPQGPYLGPFYFKMTLFYTFYIFRCKLSRKLVLGSHRYLYWSMQPLV